MGKVYCVVCKEKCKGDVLKITNSYLHDKCFNCSTCGKKLSNDGFFTHNDTFYCKEDYKKLFSSDCNICLKPLQNEIVEILGKKFHPECFKCSSCSYIFKTGDKATFHSDKFFCSKCQKPVKKKTLLRKSQKPLQGSQKELIIQIDHKGIKNDEFRDLVATNRTDKDMNGHSKGHVSMQIPPNTDPVKRSLLKNGTSEPRMENSKIKPTLCYTMNSEDEIIYATNASKHNKLEKGVSTNSMQISNTPLAQSTMLNTATMSGLGSSLISTTIPSNQHLRNHSGQSFNTRRTAPPGIDYGRHFPISYLHLEERGLTAAFSTESVNQSGTMGHCSRRDDTMRPEKDRYILRRQLSPGGTLSGTMGHRTVSANARDHMDTMNSLMYSSTYKNGPSNSFNKTKKSFRSTPNVTKNSMKVLADKMSREVAAQRRAFTPEIAHQMSSEARKLAMFPSGHLPDSDSLPVIDRYDWPAPPSPSVVMLDRRREKRLTSNSALNSTRTESLSKFSTFNGEKKPLNGTMSTLDNSNLSVAKSSTLPLELVNDYTTYPYKDIFESNLTVNGEGEKDGDTLSTATMRNTSPIQQDSRIDTLKRVAPNSEFTSALIQEIEAENHFKSKTGLDIISSSRSPNATMEPRYPTRYDNHLFTSPSRDIRHKHYYNYRLMYPNTGSNTLVERFDSNTSGLRSDYFDSNTIISCPSTPRQVNGDSKSKTLQVSGRAVSLNRSNENLLTPPHTNGHSSSVHYSDEIVQNGNGYHHFVDCGSYEKVHQHPPIVNGRGRLMTLLRQNQNRIMKDSNGHPTNGDIHSRSQNNLITQILKRPNQNQSESNLSGASRVKETSLDLEDKGSDQENYDHVTGLRIATSTPESRYRSRTVDPAHHRSRESGLENDFYDNQMTVNDHHMNGLHSQMDLTSNPFPSVQSWLKPSNRFALKQPKKYKKYPYEDLKTIAMEKKAQTKGSDIDRNKLELHLDNNEFETVFQMPFYAFQRLPLWKQNDLKLRVGLFAA